MPTAALQRQTTGLVAVDGRTFPLVRARLQSRAQGGLAHSTLIQDYLNPHDEPLEVIYTMPLPADGSVLGYTIQLGERVVRGKIEPREQAREQYLEALERGHSAGLLEQERADTFTQTLGNLPPGENVRVRIEVLQPLAFERGDGEQTPSWFYRFPTVVGVRYEGAEGRVPDAGKLDTPRADGAGTPVRLELRMLVADGGPEATAPRSTSHPISTTAVSEGTRICTTEAARLDRDLVVSWSAASDAVEAGLVEGRGLEGDDGRYALLSLTPPAIPEVAFSRDLTVLIDASGSMAGAPLEQAKEVVRALICSLGEGDRFELAAFASKVQPLTPGQVPVSSRERVDEALVALALLRAGGATEMRQAIVDALEQLRPDSQRQVVLISDGYIGFEHEVIGEVMRKLPAGTRLHAVGIGSSPNRSLTAGVARAGRGLEILIGDGASVVRSAASLLRGTAKPVLTDVVIGGRAVVGSAPARPRDVFAGQPLVVALELKPEGGVVEVTARLAGDDRPWTRHFDVPPGTNQAIEDSLPLGALYGRERVADSEMELSATRHEFGEVADASVIRRLGLRHRIVTRETSMIAISEDPTVDPTDPRRRRRLAVELPHGVSAEGVGLGDQGRLVDLCRDPTSVRDQKFSHTDVTQFLRLAVGSSRAQPPTVVARIVRKKANLLVIEFKSPGPEFPIPGKDDNVTVVGGLGKTDSARIDASASTRRGSHEAGLTIRLVLRPTGMMRWKFHKRVRNTPLEIVWKLEGEVYRIRVREDLGGGA